jgi:hypothetical protein
VTRSRDLKAEYGDEWKLYVEVGADMAADLVRKGLASRSDRPYVVDVTDRIVSGRWVPLGEGSYVLSDTTQSRPKVKGQRAQVGLGWWVDGAITRERGVHTLWIEGLPYSVFKRFVRLTDAA